MARSALWLVLWAVGALRPPPRAAPRRQLVESGATRRQLVQIVGGGAALAVCSPTLAAAAADDALLLPPAAVSGIEAGRAVVLPDWLPAAEVAALRADAVAMHGAGHFTADALATYGVKVRERENVPRTFRLLAPERSLSF